MTATRRRRTTRLKASDCPLDLQQYARKLLERLDSGRYDIKAIDLSHLSDRNLQDILGFVPDDTSAVDLSEILNLAEVDRISERVIMASSAEEQSRNDALSSGMHDTWNSGIRKSLSALRGTYRELEIKASGYPKSVPGFRCTVSPAGTVRSTISGRTLKQEFINSLAYVRVEKDDETAARVRVRVARLVVLAAGIECHCKTVLHIDNDFTNYALDNLRVLGTSEARKELASMRRAYFHKDPLSNYRTVCPAKTAMMDHRQTKA